MKKSTIVIPRMGDIVWLALKKRGIGAGMYNGWGGKFDPEQGDVTVLDTAIRETGQETDGFYPNPESLELVAVIDFYEAVRHIFERHIYFLHMVKGEPEKLRETDEMGEGVAFDIDHLPNGDKMMPADKIWLPKILRGERIRGHCYYKAGNKEVERFECEPLTVEV